MIRPLSRDSALTTGSCRSAGSLLAALAVALLPVVAAAQSGPAPGRFAPLPQIGLPLPEIGLPLPQIGLPLPSIGLPRATVARPADIGRPPSGGVPGSHPGKHHRPGPTVFYVFPTYPWDYPFGAPGGTLQPGYFESSTAERPKPSKGTLRLDLHPERGVQFYVDGFFVGTAEDLDGELELEAGPHRIEIRAPGYAPVDVDVSIIGGRSITYRGTLAPLDATTPPAAPVETPDTTPATGGPVYFIPGCYLGNVPPKDAGLPAHCTHRAVTTFDLD